MLSCGISLLSGWTAKSPGVYPLVKGVRQGFRAACGSPDERPSAAADGAPCKGRLGAAERGDFRCACTQAEIPRRSCAASAPFNKGVDHLAASLVGGH